MTAAEHGAAAGDTGAAGDASGGNIEAGAAVLRAVLGELARPTRPLPIVTVTWAQSAAGAIATEDGRPVALSGPQSLVLTHRLRAAHDAILVGITTVLSDDPLLSVRLLPGRPPQPRPVVLDSHLRFPPSARLLAREDRTPWVFFRDDSLGRAEELQRRGARLFRVPPGPGGLDLYSVLQVLSAEGIRSLMVEGGARVLRAFITSGFADQLVVTESPSPIKGLAGPTIPALDRRLSENVGADVVTWGTLNP